MKEVAQLCDKRNLKPPNYRTLPSDLLAAIFKALQRDDLEASLNQVDKLLRDFVS
jgi:hypothetical protein